MTMITPQLCNSLLATPSAPGWKAVGIKQHHGINVPLFSLHTKNSGGIGEFHDLKWVIDWCHQVNFNVIQLLPLNDTGPEPSPYSSISAFALNPLHISLSSLPGVETYKDLAGLLAELQLLTKKQRVDYPTLHIKRDLFLQLYYQYTYAHQSQLPDYLNFTKENPWLQGYALFKALKEISNWQPLDSWPSELQDPCPAEIERLQKKYETQISYHIFLQYLCFKQFEEVRKYAQFKNILLKGDIPILISRESADVWLHRKLFIMDQNAGAPPDIYSQEGQNWHFPLYNWEEMEKDHYTWWQERLKVAGRLYDIFRIDHIVGFFRIWAIPLGQASVQGKFFPEDETQWAPLGKKNLTMMLKNCSMLPIGEDLGAVPPKVRECLKNLGICATKVMRWERNWEGDKSFIDIHAYPPESMTTVSTHDSETLKQWWKNHPEEALYLCQAKGWKYEPDLSFEKNLAILKDSHRSPSLFHINLLHEYFSLFPYMAWDELSDERINDPSGQSTTNWTYRYRLCFEEIYHNSELIALMKSLIEVNN
ncbi:4-alpha-glucanotransferase [Neochlamydia sp. TUME1]|nr:4-alpha-glucanotransferase [Neochlamydia sp. TUME1]